MSNTSGKRVRSISYAKYGYLFILPFFVIYIVFQIYPLFNTFYLSTQSNGTTQTEFVGMDNFKALMIGENATISHGDNAGNKGGRAWRAANGDFKRVMGNTIMLWVGNFIPQILISLVLAAWFTNSLLKIKGKSVYKILMYLPNIITAASSAALFVMLFSGTEFGAINNLLLKWGWIHDPIPFVTGVSQSRVMIMIIQTWMWYGNTTIMLMSGIMGINGSFFEAASIDGATMTQQFFRITLPLLRPILLYTVVTSMIGGLQMFDMPYLYKNGTQITKHVETVAVYIYNHFHSAISPNYGYSAAASVLLFILTAILGAFAFKMNRDKDQKHLKRKKQNKLL